VPGWGTIPRMLEDLAGRYPDAPVILDGLDHPDGPDGPGGPGGPSGPGGRDTRRTGSGDTRHGPDTRETDSGAARDGHDPRGAGDVFGGGRRITLAELHRRATAVARALIAVGVEHGDRVAVWGLNDAWWAVHAFGAWAAGAIIVPLSSRYKGIEAADMLRRTGARVLMAGAAPDGTVFAELLASAAGPPAEDRPFAGLPELRHAIVPEEAVRPGTTALPEFLAAGERVDPATAAARARAVRPDDLCEILSTSGTTGTPKGVMLDHAQVLRGYWDWSEIVTLREGDRYPVIAPFAHGFGLNAGLLASVMRRALMIPIGVFRPDALVDLIESRRVSILAGPPTLFYRLLDELDAPHAPGAGATSVAATSDAAARRTARDLSSLRVAICGAAAVPAELIRRLMDRVGLERMINAYGLMEGTVVSMTREGDPVEVVASSTGRPVPGIEVKLVDDTGAEVPVGARGEILERGYGVMRGYWGEPAKTAEVLKDGWLHTGDIGTLDTDGNLTIVDRKKDLFIVGGFNVSPAEVEGLLLREGSLAQAAVVGVPDDRMGEVGWAYVVPRPGMTVDPGKLVEWARANMSNYKVPRRVIVVAALPVNTNGKVDKQALRARVTHPTP
jgi:acyl-CoA synthetase (AMP-forming)/AMP-acid ligase II